MAYTLQATITKARALSQPLPDSLRRVTLPGGVDMVPIGKAALKAHDFPFLPLTDEGNDGLPLAIAKLCEHLSTECLPTDEAAAKFHVSIEAMLKEQEDNPTPQQWAFCE